MKARKKILGFSIKLQEVFGRNPVNYFIYWKTSGEIRQYHIKIMKTLALLFVILVLANSTSSPLEFQFGTSLARFVRNQGIIPFYCIGGSGSYQFTFSGMPIGWTQNGNSIVIPDLTSLRGTYLIGVYVQDTAGNTLSGNINLNINGLAVVISPAANNQNNANTGNLGLALGGTQPTAVPVIGGTTTTPTSVAGSATPSPSIAQLYASQPGLPAGTNVAPDATSRFPSTPTPSGTPSTPNVVPNIIRTIQAPYDPQRDSTPPTVDTVKRNAVFNRQINANKAVANLVAIIQQLTANVNAARNDIPLLERELADKEIAYNDCTNEIFGMTDTRTRIENAIATRTDKINEANNRINAAISALDQLQRALEGLIRERTQAQNAVSPNAQKLTELERNLATCQNKLMTQQGDLDNLNQQISVVETKTETIRTDVNNAPFEIDRINIQIPIIDGRIADLEKQLANARQEKVDLLAEREGFRRVIQEGPVTITNLERQITTLRNRIPGLQEKIADTQAECDAIQSQLNAFRDELARNEVSFQVLLTEIDTQQNLVDTKNEEIAQIRDSIKDLPNELNLLRSELARVNSNLNRQYYICNSASDNVRKAKQNLEALSMRLDSETQWLAEANQNLEKARSEKQLADIAVEELLGTYTNALPFSIVPNGQGLTDAGNPAGNNPSGSPLGPVPVRNEVNPNDPVIIGDISSYLSRAYGASVDPARPETVSTVYPLSVITLEALLNKSRVGFVNPVSNYTPPAGNIYGFQCNVDNNFVAGQGTVLSVQPGMIQVRNSQSKTINLQIAGCSSMESTQRNHILGLNDVVYYKGSPASTSGNINLYSLTNVAK